MAVRIQLRHDTKANWEKENPLLLKGEIGIEMDGDQGRGRIKIGKDARWNETPYYDENFVHTSKTTELVRGLKQFVDGATFGEEGKENVDVKIVGNLEVSEKIKGTVEQAEKDSKGNIISDYYQKKMSTGTSVGSNVDWNDVTEIGLHYVEVDFWSENLKNQPSIYVANISKRGILSVQEDNEGNLLQIYTPFTITLDTSEVNTVVFRIYNNGDWTAWKSYGAEDYSLVHIAKAETITGQKTFADTPIIRDGVVEFGGIYNNAELQNGGNTFLKREQSGNVILCGDSNSNVYLRPNGATQERGQVVIDSTGVIDGKCTKDGEGNVISDTYATKSSIKKISAGLSVPVITDRQEDEETYNEILEYKYSSFDINKFNITGELVINDNTVESFENGSVLPKTTTFRFAEDDKINTYINVIIPEDNAFATEQTILDTSAFTLTIGANKLFKLNTKQVPLANEAEFGKEYQLIIKTEANGKLGLYIDEEKIVEDDPLYITNNEPAEPGEDGINYRDYTINAIGATDLTCHLRLNSFCVIINDKEIFSGKKTGVDVIDEEISIPFTYSNNGLKVVDMVNCNLVDDCYDKYQTANYFIIDEEGKQFRLPMDSPNGFNHTLSYFRNGKTYFEYDTNLECTQTGTCTADTPVVLPKAFADENYILNIPTSSRTATGFTPTASGDFIAKGRITLG